MASSINHKLIYWTSLLKPIYLSWAQNQTDEWTFPLTSDSLIQNELITSFTRTLLFLYFLSWKKMSKFTRWYPGSNFLFSFFPFIQLVIESGQINWHNISWLLPFLHFLGPSLDGDTHWVMPGVLDQLLISLLASQLILLQFTLHTATGEIWLDWRADQVTSLFKMIHRFLIVYRIESKSLSITDLILYNLYPPTPTASFLTHFPLKCTLQPNGCTYGINRI